MGFLKEETLKLFRATKMQEEYASWLLGSELAVAQTGSFAYGLATETSDTDYMVVVMPPLEYSFGFKTFETFNESSAEGKNTSADYDYTFQSLKHYVKVLQGGGASALEFLFLKEEQYEYLTPLFKELREHKELFLSKNLLLSFLGAENKLESQLLKETPARKVYFENYGYDTKKFAQAVRHMLLLKEAFTEGTLTVKVSEENRKMLLGYRNGALSYEEASKLLREKYNELVVLQEQSTLPSQSSKAEVEKLVVSLYKKHFQM